MKLFFLSDIHGSLFFLEKALRRFEEEKAGAILLLGDELYHGARNPLPEGYNPKKVAETLNGYADRIVAVRGNCDSEVDEMVLQYPIMSTYSMVFYSGRRIFLTHGHIFNEEKLPPLQGGDLFAYGHTHIPRAVRQGNLVILNPGSVSIPKGGFPHSYGVLEGSRFAVKDLDGKEFMQIDF
jgi:putative phosphoesterase